MRLRWLLADALALALAAFGAAAASRPYADNQRNWLIVAAVLSGLALAVIVLARSLAAGAKAVVSEWKPTRVGAAPLYESTDPKRAGCTSSTLVRGVQPLRRKRLAGSCFSGQHRACR